ncbi:hypothetical protein GCM10010389_18680 [Streptomyces echinoruber]|uniref:Uncharacterized protein n=1 Tax=Streptomyces echinoruber TaxID=68898 RepID=A0A918R1U1_9ACTN|nr:hypothetical protein GCM10010389_18680 [Streptomyces echinoruber]
MTSLPFVGLALLLSPVTPSAPQAASERDIVDAATHMAIRRRMGELTSGAFRTRAQHCDPGD